MPRPVLQTSLCLPALAALATLGLAGEFPGPPATDEIQAAIDRADHAYGTGDYETAFRLYRHELSPIGDKFAQHRIGLMYLQGQGVDADVPRGAAWLELAAERGDEQLVALRDEIWPQLTASEQEQVSPVLKRLRDDYGDCAIVRKLLAADEKALQPPTGSRIPGASSQAVTGINLGTTALSKGEIRQLKETVRIREAYMEENCR